ncbi:hypothetical protein CHARACLAT_029153 [Characodon lateralis]|uniref:Uncharacterized protein n=1 Tax=Characodon lateralis TaxID=208331 RepID=A0ABU7F0A7_9TELE|nr:hypothetical protein [Characodon lateralis]
MAVGTDIKTQRERRFLAPRNLDGGLNEAMYTGSYSTRTEGMTTADCPGSSPRTPAGSNGKDRRLLGTSADSAADIYSLAELTDLVFLQGEKLVTRRTTTDQLPSTIKGGEA